MKTSVEINHADTYNDKTAVEKTTLMKNHADETSRKSFRITPRFLWNKPRWYNNKTAVEKTTLMKRPENRFGILHDLTPTWLHDYYTLIVHHF